MSLVSLANGALLRARAIALPRAREGPTEGVAPDENATSAFESLAKYIPTEVVTLYVAGVSVTTPLATSGLARTSRRSASTGAPW